MDMELVNRARRDAAVRRCIAVAVNMAALTWEDESACAADRALEVRELAADILGAPPLPNDPPMDPNTTPGDVIGAAMIKAHSDVNRLLTELLELALAHVQTAHLPAARERLQAVLQQWRGEHLALEPIGLPPELQEHANDLYRQRIDVLVERVRGVLDATGV